jgi:cytochrome c553
MHPIAPMLSADDIADLAAFYSGANAPLPSLAAPTQHWSRPGNSWQWSETPQRPCRPAIIAMDAAPDYRPQFPPLAGQFAPYVVSELQLWQRGMRKNNGGAQMSDLMQRLDERDIAAVAAYYQAGEERTPRERGAGQIGSALDAGAPCWDRPGGWDSAWD